MSDYQRDYDDGFNRNVMGDSLSTGYADGQAARARLDAGQGGTSTGLSSAGAVMASEYQQGKVRFYVRSFAQTVVFSLIVGALAGGLAILNNKPPTEWALLAGGITAAICLGIIALFTLGLAIGYFFVLLMLPFALWRWLLAFGAGSAAVGYVLASSAGKVGALAQQQAVEYGIVGLGIGFVLGFVYRLVRRKPRPS